uniref:Uncharacterized protein n=1 Tax=Arundo donax TaxID=35708 RepID=A0A0A8YY93_ARUDO
MERGFGGGAEFGPRGRTWRRMTLCSSTPAGKARSPTTAGLHAAACPLRNAVPTPPAVRRRGTVSSIVGATMLCRAHRRARPRAPPCCADAARRARPRAPPCCAARTPVHSAAPPWCAAKLRRAASACSAALLGCAPVALLRPSSARAIQRRPHHRRLLRPCSPALPRRDAPPSSGAPPWRARARSPAPPLLRPSLLRPCNPAPPLLRPCPSTSSEPRRQRPPWRTAEAGSRRWHTTAREGGRGGAHAAQHLTVTGVLTWASTEPDMQRNGRLTVFLSASDGLPPLKCAVL